MYKKHLNHISSLIILACLLANVPITASACASVEQATNAVKKKASEVMSQPNPSSNSTASLTPPSSSYPLDIIGRVTIAHNMVVGNVLLPQPKDYCLWIVHAEIRNKEYPFPVGFNGNWNVVIASNHEAPTGIGVLYNCPPSTVTIPQGQSGEIIFCLDAPINFNPSDYQLCYSEQPPQRSSYGQLINTNPVVEVYDWDLKKVRTDIFSVTMNGKVIPLQLIKSFTGDNTKIVDFTADKSPVIVIWGTTQTSQIQSSFEIYAQGGDGTYSDIGSDLWTIPGSETMAQALGTKCFILDAGGKYKLKIQSSGCSWWVKVGVELGG